MQSQPNDNQSTVDAQPASETRELSVITKPSTHWPRCCIQQALTNKQSIPCITTQAKCKVMTAKCPVKHKPLQKGSFSFHSSQNIYTCHFKTSALLIVSFVDTKLNARIKPKCCFQPTIEPKCKMSPWPNSALKTCVTHWHTQMESAREKSVPQCFLVDASLSPFPKA